MSKNWGGHWTQKKLDAFEDYVKTYLTIMHSQKKKKDGWPYIIYIDGFAGTGEINPKKDNKEYISLKEVYKGAAERVLSLDKKFDEYVFIDINKKALEKLYIKLNAKDLLQGDFKIHFIPDDVNITIKNIAKTLDKSKAALILLDAFGMQIDWETIEALKGKRVDLWILLPSGVAINRLIKKDGSLLNPEKLEKNLGIPANKIKERFYKINTKLTLFGTETQKIKVENAIDVIAEMYIEQMKKIWKFVTEKPLKLKNTNNTTIFHFIFASNNETAHKIAKYIIKKKNTQIKKKSKIEWTEQVWNPSIGCTKVSAGCKYCYAEVFSLRLKAMGNPDYKDGFKFKVLPHRLQQPLKITKPTKFFVNSMSDLFHEEMPFDFLDKVFEVIEKSPQHSFQILTKRAEIMKQYFASRNVPDNVWLGVSVESKAFVYRIDILRTIPANIRFISFEPLIGDVGELDLSSIHWAIVGGESGKYARKIQQKWVENIFYQCQQQNVPFFFKQWGTWGADGIKRSKKANGRLFKGKIWEEFPEQV